MLAPEAKLMAEPKKRKPKMGRPKGPKAPRKIIISFKGYEEFDGWLQRLATFRRLPVSVLIEHALIEYARAHEFNDDAPER
jgi:hypothetical protein